MIVGCAKEIKTHEYRVGFTPQNVKEYIEAGHQVLIERGAGEAIGFLDSHYEKYGAKLVNKDELFEKSQMIVKVKEPLQSEYEYFRENQILYTYLHLAADENLTQMLLKKHISSIAYETIKVGNALPCLAPMSAIAGRLAIFEAAKYSQKTYGGSGILLSGIAGVKKGKVVIIGGGVVGINAAQIALGIGADVVIGAILIPGAKAPKIVNKNDLSIMKKSSILVDVAIDQGGCFETSKPTTHSDPIYVFDDIVHYCVANMPGCVAKTSTLALTDVTLKFGLQIANNGFKEAVLKNEVLLSGLNTYKGMCTYEAVAKAFNIDYIDAKKALA
ncbi:alanine dehydrogenase [Campylobacter hepaticus]|nr:alanine dehydrogenase [Campylobacter hepaticus]